MKRRYLWRRELRQRFDLTLMGEPDCHAYVIRYAHPSYGGAWCWKLRMPRGGSVTYTNWASSSHEAKRQVEKTIEEYWNT
jgi:hypothetical protein